VHQFCSTTGAVYNPNPSYPPPAAKLKVDPTTWAAAPWTCLQFTINEPQFFSYGYVSSGSGTAALYTAVANGDLDGNGVLSTFTLSGSGGPTGDAQRLAFTVVNEDE
jgi:type IV pilus assembly protein PilA